MIRYVVFLLVLFLASSVNSQNFVCEGRVMAFKRYPVKGAEVKARKAGETVFTDSAGVFKLSCEEDDVLKIKADGFFTEKIRVDEVEAGMEVNLILIDNANSKKRALKAGHLSKEDLEYALNNLMNENNNFDRLKSVFQVIQYVDPGAKIIPVDGVKKVFLNSRGPNSLQSGMEALLMVDGVVRENISDIHPAEIESVEVLEAHESSDYGTRGGNGVVVIELKH